MSEPRVDAVIGTFYRKGRCAACGKRVERERSFRGATYEDMEQQGAKWGETPLVHKRCEGLPLGDTRPVESTDPL